MYKIKKEKGFLKEFNKLRKKDLKSYKIINKKINELKKKPFPSSSKHILSSNSNKLLCELAYKIIRVYYIITKKELIIETIKYKGFINVLNLKKNHKSGNKQNNPNQQKYITKTKKDFKNQKG